MITLYTQLNRGERSIIKTNNKTYIGDSQCCLHSIGDGSGGRGGVGGRGHVPPPNLEAGGGGGGGHVPLPQTLRLGEGGGGTVGHTHF